MSSATQSTKNMRTATASSNPKTTAPSHVHGARTNALTYSSKNKSDRLLADPTSSQTSATNTLNQHARKNNRMRFHVLANPNTNADAKSSSCSRFIGAIA